MNVPAATMRPRYETVAEGSGLFKDSGHPSLLCAPIQQLWREHMLSQTMLDNCLYDTGLFLVVHPAKNEDCSAAVASYKQHLRAPSSRNPAFAALTLEECVQGVCAIGELELAEALYARYLDLDRINEAIFGQEVQPM